MRRTYTQAAKRECARCGRVKYLSEFPARPGAPDGHLKICRICWMKQYQGKHKNWYKTRLRNKTCAECGERLPVSRFYKDKKQPDGRAPVCKKCRQWVEWTQPKISQFDLGLKGLRQCRMCRQIKPLEEFYYCASMLFQHGYRCSDCSRKRREELRRERRRSLKGPG